MGDGKGLPPLLVAAAAIAVAVSALLQAAASPWLSSPGANPDSSFVSSFLLLPSTYLLGAGLHLFWQRPSGGEWVVLFCSLCLPPYSGDTLLGAVLFCPSPVGGQGLHGAALAVTDSQGWCASHCTLLMLLCRTLSCFP